MGSRPWLRSSRWTDSFVELRTPERSAGLVRDRGTEPELAGYEVVGRETTDPDWTHAVPVGDVTSASFPHFSKDTVLFGVRAVDRDGDRSPVALPTPQT